MSDTYRSLLLDNGLILIVIYLFFLSLICLIGYLSFKFKKSNAGQRCYECGYDLRGSVETSEKCPECGLSYVEGELATAGDKKAAKANLRSGCMLIVVAIGILVLFMFVAFVSSLL